MRILFVQPGFLGPGGGAGLAAWMLQALTGEHDVTVLSWDPVDVGQVNRFWGTSLRDGDFRLIRVPTVIRRLVDALPLPLHLLRTAFMLRAAQRMLPRYDVPVTANNEADFGTVGVQYVHYPWNVFPRPNVDIRWYHLKMLLPLYYGLCSTVSRFTVAGMHRNITLVNSDWTGRLAHQRYGFVTRTVYPPVTAEVPDVPWDKREPGFVCIGRIAPEKELDRVIDVVTGVHRQVPGVTLHIVGTPEDGPYHRRIAERARAAGFTLHENLSRAELGELMAHQRYGIHGKSEEHFGMAPAEMVLAGCVVWVPNGGGQVEIVDEPRLTYDSVEDAVAKIVRVLRTPAEQDALRAHLAARAPRFSTDRFMREIRAAVADAAARAAPGREAAAP
jgi:glycosyltransferase involved in cell wall biosynthesis